MNRAERPSAGEVLRPFAFPPEPRRTAVLLALHTGVRLTRSPRPNQSRGFRIGPMGRHAVVSGERSDTISVDDIDPTSAALKLLQKYPTGQPPSQLGPLLASAMVGYLVSSFSSGALVACVGVGRQLLWSSVLMVVRTLSPAWRWAEARDPRIAAGDPDLTRL